MSVEERIKSDILKEREILIGEFRQNFTYIKLNNLSSPFSFWGSKAKCVVPKFSKLPAYTFYLNSGIYSKGENKSILGYMPVSPESFGISDLHYFERICLNDAPFGDRQTMAVHLCKALFDSFRDMKLKSRADALFNEFPVDFLGTFAICDLDVLGIFQLILNHLEFEKLRAIWTSYKLQYSMYRKRSSINRLICNVCSIFECGIHPNQCNYSLDSDFNNVSLFDYKQILVTAKRDVLKSVIKALKPVTDCVFRKDVLQAVNVQIMYGGRPNNVDRYVDINDISDTSILYIPCNHSGKCNTRICGCFSSGGYCRVSCFCGECCGNARPQTKLRTGSSRKKIKMDVKKQISEHSICRNLLSNHLYISLSRVAGYGCFTHIDLPADTLVAEYISEIITDSEAERRGFFYELRKCNYIFAHSSRNGNATYALDAMRVGSISRFINHSSVPNLQATAVCDKGFIRIYFYSRLHIKAHSELLFNYYYRDDLNEKYGLM